MFFVVKHHSHTSPSSIESLRFLKLVTLDPSFSGIQDESKNIESCFTKLFSIAFRVLLKSAASLAKYRSTTLKSNWD